MCSDLVAKKIKLKSYQVKIHIPKFIRHRINVHLADTRPHLLCTYTKLETGAQIRLASIIQMNFNVGVPSFSPGYCQNKLRDRKKARLVSFG